MRRFIAKRLAGLDDPFLDDLNGWARTPFQTKAFLAALSATAAPALGAELILVGVEGPDGSPIALFPFTLSHEGGLTVAEAVGLGSTDYFVPPCPEDLSLAPNEAGEIWKAVIGMLPEADIARLRNVPLEYDGKPHPFSAARFLRPMGHYASILPIAPQQKASGGDATRKLKKLQRRGAVEFTSPADASARAELLDAMFAMRRARFAELGRRDYLDQPGVQTFYRALAQDTDGVVEIAGLKLNGEVLAVIYGLRHNGRFTLLIPTMTSDDRWRDCSPGLVAMHLLIEQGRALGWHTFDFSIGEMQYKSRFGAQKVDLFEVQRALRLRAVPRVVVARLRSAVRTLRLRNRHVAVALQRIGEAKLRLAASRPARLET